MPTIFASTPKWPSVSTSLRPTASWSRGSGPLSPSPLLERLRRRRPVVDLLRGGHAALLPHRGQAPACSGRSDRRRPRSVAHVLAFGCGHLASVAGSSRRPASARRRRPRAAERDGRLELVRLRVGAHHVGRARLRSRRRASSRSRRVLAGSGRRSAPRPAPPTKTPRRPPGPARGRSSRDRGAGQQHPTDHQHQDGEDPGPDRRRTGRRARFRPRSRPCPPPSRRRGRRPDRRRRRSGTARSGRGAAARGPAGRCGLRTTRLRFRLCGFGVARRARASYART